MQIATLSDPDPAALLLMHHAQGQLCQGAGSRSSREARTGPTLPVLPASILPNGSPLRPPLPPSSLFRTIWSVLPPLLLPASHFLPVCPQPKASLQPECPAWSCPEPLSWVALGGSSLPPKLAAPQLHLAQGESQEEPLEGLRLEAVSTALEAQVQPLTWEIPGPGPGRSRSLY